MNLKGSAAVITGASTGIGRAIAEALATQGVKIGLVGRNTEGLERTAKAVAALEGEVRVLKADLRDQRAIEAIAMEARKSWGGPDIIVNVAGVWHDDNRAYAGRDMAEIPGLELDEVLDVGIRAPMQLTRLLLPPMIQRRKGKILNISGTFSSGGAGWLHYYVSKKAIEHFTVGLSDELRKHGIEVNCISPSDVATEALAKFFPDDAATALAPAAVADLAVFLAGADVAEHITGQIIVIKQKSIT